MVNEGKHKGILYHFINMDTLKHLINTGFIFKTRLNDIDSENKNIAKYLGFRTSYFLSLSRKYDFNWNDIRITFDGDSLVNNFKV